MKANSMSICIPSIMDEGFFCNKNCPYCVSKMTGENRIDRMNFVDKLAKAYNMAHMSQVNSIIITGKTEPLMNMTFVEKVCNMFKNFPIEIQTNGLMLNEKMVEKLYLLNIDTIAVSMDSPEQFEKMKDIFGVIDDYGMTARITVNLVNDLMNDDKFGEFKGYLDYCKENSVSQLSFRKITIPNYAVDTKASKEAQDWIKQNVDEEQSQVFIWKYKQELKKDGIHLYDLPFGASLYMMDGISCTYFEYCIQDSHTENDIRSLIYYEDGHMATTWYGSNFGRIF